MADLIDYEYVVCKHCGERFGAITAGHLRSQHGYTGAHPVQEYIGRFGLVSASSSDARQKLKEQRIEFWARRGQHWTRDKVLAVIRRRYQAGESLRAKQVPNALQMAANRYFGSWAVALQMSSIDYDAITLRRKWTREKVIATIRKLEADQVPLSSSWISKHHGDLHRAALRLFPSSWEKALKAAGLDPSDHKKRKGRWTRKTATAWTEQRIKKGRSLLARDTPADLRQFVSDVMNATWTEFVESFGIAYPGVKKRRDWSREKLIEEIRRWAAEGHRTNVKSVSREYQALLHQARKYFSSWDAARTAAGVPLERGRAPRPVAAAIPPVGARASVGEPAIPVLPGDTGRSSPLGDREPGRCAVELPPAAKSTARRTSPPSASEANGNPPAGVQRGARAPEIGRQRASAPEAAVSPAEPDSEKLARLLAFLRSAGADEATSPANP